MLYVLDRQLRTCITKSLSVILLFIPNLPFQILSPPIFETNLSGFFLIRSNYSFRLLFWASTKKGVFVGNTYFLISLIPVYISLSNLIIFCIFNQSKCDILYIGIVLTLVAHSHPLSLPYLQMSVVPSRASLSSSCIGILSTTMVSLFPTNNFSLPYASWKKLLKSDWSIFQPNLSTKHHVYPCLQLSSLFSSSNFDCKSILSRCS